jgi:hypothetical protein
VIALKTFWRRFVLSFSLVHDMTTPTQAKPYVHWTMRCQNPDCGQPIPLPPPKNQDESSNQLEWPMEWKKFFVCAQCGHGYEYSGKHVHRENQDIQSPWESGKRQCYSVRYVCDVGNCDTQIAAYAVESPGVQLYETISTRAAYPWKIGYWCPKPDKKMYDHFASMPEQATVVRFEQCAFPF